MDFSASGLRQVALQFQKSAPKLNISKLIGAPNLETLELEFPSILGLELPLQIAQRRHNKPFRLTLIAFLPKTPPLTFPLDWATLEQSFGPQDYTKWRRTGLALHQPLVRESNRKQKSIYCNKAYTAAVRARIPRLAAALQSATSNYSARTGCVRDAKNAGSYTALIMAGLIVSHKQLAFLAAESTLISLKAFPIHECTVKTNNSRVTCFKTQIG